MRCINLTNSPMKAIVDDVDYMRLSQYDWYLVPTGYAVRSFEGRQLLMHRDLMLPTGRQIVDHRNTIRLDNRRCNLRLCTKKENQWNRSKTLQPSTSMFKGVTRADDRPTNPWRAAIKFRGRTIKLGSFPKERWAAMAYDIAARQLFGEYAKPNFTTNIYF